MSLIDRLKKILGGDAAPEAPQGSGEEGISCREAVTTIYEFLDGDLEGVSHEKVKAHFDVCSRCYPHLRLEEQFRGALQRASRGDAAPPELKSRLQSLLAEADQV